MFTVVVTSQPDDVIKGHGTGCAAVTSIGEAIDLLTSGPGSEDIEQIYVLGGRRPYEVRLESG